MGFEGRITFFPFLLCFVFKKNPQHARRNKERSPSNTHSSPFSQKKHEKGSSGTHKKKRGNSLFLFDHPSLSFFSLSLSLSLFWVTKKVQQPFFLSSDLLHRRLDQQARDGVGVDVGGRAPVLEVALVGELDGERDADRRAAVGDARPRFWGFLLRYYFCGEKEGGGGEEECKKRRERSAERRCALQSWKKYSKTQKLKNSKTQKLKTPT